MLPKVMLLYALIALLASQESEQTCAVDDVSCFFNEKLATSTITLNDGVEIPIIGLGTWVASRTERTREYWDAEKGELYSSDKSAQMSQQVLTADQEEEELFKNAIITAVKAGYRHIDSAIVYRTESVVGDALQQLYKTTDVKRQDLFITTKVPRQYRDMDQVRAGIEGSFKLLQTDFIDLYLIHSPHSDAEEGKRGTDVLEIYQILLAYQKQGRIKSVGVSNFGVQHLQSIERNGLPLPSVNQIEVSVFLVEEELIEYCQKKGIVIEAYSALAQANEPATSNDVLVSLAKKYSSQVKRELTFAHIMLRWCVDKGFVVLPKSVTPTRIVANGNVFDFELSAEDMKKLDQLKQTNYRICWNPLHEIWDV